MTTSTEPAAEPEMKRVVQKKLKPQLKSHGVQVYPTMLKEHK